MLYTKTVTFVIFAIVIFIWFIFSLQSMLVNSELFDLKHQEPHNTITQNIPISIISNSHHKETNAKIINTTISSYIKTYKSSEWETIWLQNIKEWQKKNICNALQEQNEYLQIFLNDTCSARTNTPWCLIDDSVHSVWFHTINGKFSLSKPAEITQVTTIKAIKPSNHKVWSRFEYRNMANGEVTYEYIEPLVSHLRHPLAECGPDGHLFLVDRSYILPGNTQALKQRLFDAGSSSWFEGAGGPSLSYFAQVWGRYGFSWDSIEAWEGKTSVENFYKTVPPEWKARITFHGQFISTNPNQNPFVPLIIENTTKKEDYVVFKLDIDSKAVETSIVEFILQWRNLDYIDEFVWEHHVQNYLMSKYWGRSQDMTKTIADSYQYFLKLRQLGVRAHSWV